MPVELWMTPGAEKPSGAALGYRVGLRRLAALSKKSNSGVGLFSKKPPDLRLVEVVDAACGGVLAVGVGEVIAELELVLAGLLRDVEVGAEADAVGEGEVGRPGLGVDEVVPVLEAGGEVIHLLLVRIRAEGDVA